MPSLSKSRVESLDWLRGLVALSIMFYHLSYWCFQLKDASSVLGRLGIYGVSIFFVLSGLSVAIAYSQYIRDITTVHRFLVRRLFRIWPLLWIATIVTAAITFSETGVFNWGRFLLNITTLFGFFKPGSYMATGAWSIGSEMVYYVLTPLIFAVYNYRRWAGNALLFVCVGIGVLFAFWFLDPRIPLTKQWAVYINPFNNLFLYVMGIAMYYNFGKLEIGPTLNAILLFVAVALFCLLPFGGDQIAIVTGAGRMVFVTLTFVVVLAFYKVRVRPADVISNPLTLFGMATYGIYLIHPVIYLLCGFFFRRFHVNNPHLMFAVVVVLTVVTARFSYRLIEEKMIKLGKKLTAAAPKKVLEVKLSEF